MSTTYFFRCGCGREWHDTGRVKCDCGNEAFETVPISQETTRHERDLIAKDICPRCGGCLDTGWECLGCGYDAKPITDEAPPGKPAL